MGLCGVDIQVEKELALLVYQRIEYKGSDNSGYQPAVIHIGATNLRTSLGTTRLATGVVALVRRRITL